MTDLAAIWDYLMAGPHSGRTLHIVMASVALGLSNMVGKTIRNSPSRVENVPVAQVATRVGDPEVKTVGIYLRMTGGLRGQAVMFLPLTSALSLVDVLTDESPGTAKSLGMMERSVLAEVGNLTVSYFLNTVAKLTGSSNVLWPSPPTVIVDMLSTIINLMITPAAALGDDLPIIETPFRDTAGLVQIRLWILPDMLGRS
jgi:chemotaxis protein CheC